MIERAIQIIQLLQIYIQSKLSVPKKQSVKINFTLRDYLLLKHTYYFWFFDYFSQTHIIFNFGPKSGKTNNASWEKGNQDVSDRPLKINQVSVSAVVSYRNWGRADGEKTRSITAPLYTY